MASHMARRTFRGLRPLFKGIIQSQTAPILGRLYCSVEYKDTDEFDELFRNSQLVKLGRPAGKRVLGRVTHVVTREKNEDVYVDFGWKFHAVETLPRHSNFKVGDEVEVVLKNLEATGHFLGQSKRITLCEAEAKFVPIKPEEKRTTEEDG